MKIACCISHVNEPTLWACLTAVSKLKGPPLALSRVVAGKTPMTKSFNAALDIAFGARADILLHTASDVLLTDDALLQLLKPFDLDRYYLSVGRGYDAIHNRITSGGVWIFNMRVIRDRFRFRDVFKQDLDFCDRIEADTNLSRCYTSENRAVTYHHPIWTAQELYAKFRYSYPKYESSRTKQLMEVFLTDGLKMNPSNKALIAGSMGLEMAKKHGPMKGAKNHLNFEAAFKGLAQELELDGTEYYTRHKHYVGLAKSILDSSAECYCEPPAPEVPLIYWK